MSQINQTGTFRFRAIDAGINEAESGAVEWVAQLQAVEKYDEENEQWVDWSEYEEQEITAHLYLFGKEKNEIFHTKQLQKTFNWSGADFSELETKYVADITFQGRIDEEMYDGKPRLKVVWIDHCDAEPGRKLRKLGPDGIKRLNAKFASQLRDLSGGTKPKSIPAKPSIDKEALKNAKKEELEATKAKRGRPPKQQIQATAPTPTPPKPPNPPRPTAKKTAEQCNKGTAWIDCCNGRDGSVDSETLESTWHDAVDSLGGEDEVEENGRWAEVRDAVLAKVGKSPV